MRIKITRHSVAKGQTGEIVWHEIDSCGNVWLGIVLDEPDRFGKTEFKVLPHAIDYEISEEWK